MQSTQQHSQHSSPWPGAIIIVTSLVNNLPTLASGRGPSRWSEFSPSVWSGFSCFSLPYSYMPWVKKKSWYDVTVHPGGQCSAGRFLPADVAAAIHAASETTTSSSNGSTPSLGVNSVPTGELPEGGRGLALWCMLYCVFRNGNNVSSTLNKRAASRP